MLFTVTLYYLKIILSKYISYFKKRTAYFPISSFLSNSYRSCQLATRINDPGRVTTTGQLSMHMFAHNRSKSYNITHFYPTCTLLHIAGTVNRLRGGAKKSNFRKKFDIINNILFLVFDI